MRATKVESSVSQAKKKAVELAEFYFSLERAFHVKLNADYAELVTAGGNHADPVHRWFRFKEAFSSRILGRVIKDTELRERNELRLIDPFAGVGTSLVSAVELVGSGNLASADAYGVECNPFLHLVSTVKTRCYQHPQSEVLRFGRDIALRASKRSTISIDIPDLSTFRNEQYFDQGELTRLLTIREEICAAEVRGCSIELASLARVALGAIIEPVSNLRKDGRALRYSPKKDRGISALDGFLTKIDEMDVDMPRRSNTFRSVIARGDGRSLANLPMEATEVDLCLFSPPYPNNIDYTEVYKLENWLLGFLETRADFRAQRGHTLYSHPSILRSDPLPSEEITADENDFLLRCVSPIISALPEDRYFTSRSRLIRGYALDMYLTTKNVSRRLRVGGYMVCVVGNSVHGILEESVIIAADVLIATFALELGLEVVGVDIARFLSRRSVSSPFLRESVIFIRKPS
jgi:hypothetical protein